MGSAQRFAPPARLGPLSRKPLAADVYSILRRMIIRRELRPDSLISEGEITKLVKVLRKRNPREAQKALEYIWGVGQESVQRLVEQYQLVGAEPGEFADAVAEAAERRFPPATQRRGISVRPMDSSSGVLSRSSRIGGV